MEYKVLELFSGIGGMHYALQYSKIGSKVVAAVDINTVANLVYAHNFPNTRILNNNIEKLTPETISELKVNMILMSPPCQPFTRVGSQKDINDTRNYALKHLCDILPECDGIQYIVMENVKGFEKSKAHEMFLKSLNNSGYYFREFLLNPLQLGVPNSRQRYYCLARKEVDFSFESNLDNNEVPIGNLTSIQKLTIPNIISPDCEDRIDLALSANTLKKHVWLLDITTAESTSTNCFTKAYTHYCEGTGSVFTPLSAAKVLEIFELAKKTDALSNEYIETLLSLRLRYFSPCEISRFMCFPPEFQFPPQITLRQQYRLLGNSINVLVVGELIKLLCSIS